MLNWVVVATLALAMQGPEDWELVGTDSAGVRVSVNSGSILLGADGPEAMVRLHYPRPIARNVSQADVRAVFNCQTRRVTRTRLNELSATGEIVERNDDGDRMEAVTATAGTPMGRLLDRVCATTAE